MRVFLAGATGALGIPLTRRLLQAGHEVVGTTRTPHKAEWLHSAGATPVVLDAMDQTALRQAVLDARPDVVLDQLTDLPVRLGTRPFKHFYDRMTPLKATASPALLAAAREAGARMHLMQSVAFAYAPGGARAKTEHDEQYLEPPEPWDRVMPVFQAAERAVTGETTLSGLVLRYGFFYGPGTHYATDGAVAAMVRGRQYPLIGDGAGIHSFIHVEDAAAATVAALSRGRTGVYNVVDDDPLPMREWLPVYAQVLQAKRPRGVPPPLARLVAGPLAVHFATTLRGASNAKARAQLDWAPRWPSVRTGFREALG